MSQTQENLKRIRERYEFANEVLTLFESLTLGEIGAVDCNLTTGQPTWNGSGRLSFLVKAKVKVSLPDVTKEVTDILQASRLKEYVHKIEALGFDDKKNHGEVFGTVRVLMFLPYRTHDCVNVPPPDQPAAPYPYNQ